MDEVWKTIHNFSKYEISNKGNVRSNTKHGKGLILTPSINGPGYYYVHILSDNGDYKNCQIHNLVANHFRPNPDNKKCVHHKDWDKLNNAADNLQWVTYSENRKYDFDKGVGNVNMSYPGELNPRAKLSSTQVKSILHDRSKGMTYLEISHKYNVSASHIGNICRHYCWRCNADG